ncbi:hypothetical protein RFI_20458, partial [Reticulomyxa filosa]
DDEEEEEHEEKDPVLYFLNKNPDKKWYVYFFLLYHCFSKDELSLFFLKNKKIKKKDLWWESEEERIFQGTMEVSETTPINTYISHKFCFTPYGDKDTILYRVTMYKHTDLITLLSPEEMRDRDEKFEQEVLRFLFLIGCKKKKNFGVEKTKKQKKKKKSESMNVTSPQLYACASDHAFVMTDEMEGQLQSQLDTLTANKKKAEQNAHIENDDEAANCCKMYRFLLKSKAIDIASFDLMEPIIVNQSLQFVHVCVYVCVVYTCAIQESHPNAVKEYELEVLCTSPKLVLINDFLSEEECQHIIELGQVIGLKRSTVSEEAIVTTDRTSQT